MNATIAAAIVIGLKQFDNMDLELFLLALSGWDSALVIVVAPQHFQAVQQVAERVIAL